MNRHHLIRHTLGLFVLLYAANAHAGKREEWLAGLKEAERSEQGTADYFIHQPLPAGLAIVHAWDASPLIEKDRTVGHMALQIQGYYLSVWPEDKKQNDADSTTQRDHHVGRGEDFSDRKAYSVGRGEDFSNMGNSNFLVLRLPEPEYRKLRKNVRKITNDLKTDAYHFSLGVSELKMVGNGFSGSWSNGNGFTHTGVETLLRSTLLNPLTYLAYNGHFKIGAHLACMVGMATPLAPIAWGLGAANLFCDKLDPSGPDYREDIMLTLDHVNRGPFREGAINCTQSVLTSLAPIPGVLGDLSETCQGEARYKAAIPLTFKWPKVAACHKHQPYAHDSDEDLHVRIKTALRYLNISFPDIHQGDVDNLATCIVDEKEGPENPMSYNFQVLRELIRGKLTSNQGSLQGNFEGLQKRFKINQGRVNVLFTDPLLLPGGALRELAYQTHLNSQDRYLYSNFERSFGMPVGNYVRFRRCNTTGRYLMPKGEGTNNAGLAFWDVSDMKTGDRKNDAKHSKKAVFRLVPSGDDESYFILSYSDKRALGVGDQGELTCSLALFNEKQRFYFTPCEGKHEASQGAKVHIRSRHDHQYLTHWVGDRLSFSRRRLEPPHFFPKDRHRQEWLVEGTVKTKVKTPSKKSKVRRTAG